MLKDYSAKKLDASYPGCMSDFVIEDVIEDKEWLTANGYQPITVEDGSLYLGGMILVEGEDKVLLPMHSDAKGAFDAVFLIGYDPHSMWWAMVMEKEGHVEEDSYRFLEPGITYAKRI
ncbi:MAG: hypothetical protein AB9921_02460 [Erysipelotrichaceae bacterium]